MSNLEIIYSVLHQIPCGKVATYGQIAHLAGKPGGARYIGFVLRNLPTGTLLPWHRVINSKGEISLPLGTEAFNTQKERLESEGITFTPSQRVLLKDYQWQP